MKTLGFYSYHRISHLCYFATMLVLTLMTMNPIIIALSLMFSVLLVLRVCTKAELFRMLRFGLPFVGLIVLFNPLFNHRGSAVLTTLLGKPVTLEAILYGLVSGLMLLCVMLWFTVFFALLPGQRLRELFGTRLSSTALVLSMTMRLVPMLIRRQQEISDTLSLLSPPLTKAKGIATRARGLAQTVTVLLSCALEDSLDTARSMRARGYGAARCTRYKSERIAPRDIVATAAMTILFAIIMKIYTSNGLAYTFYPAMSRLYLTGWQGIYYLLFTLLAAVPLLCDGWEAIRWSC